MDRKGQLGLGILVSFIAIIVGLVLYGAIANYVSAVQTTGNNINITVTPAAAGSYLDLAGQDYLATISITNATSGGAILTTNLSIDDGVSATDSMKTVRLYTTDGAWAYASSTNVSYSYGADGYISSSGGRAMANLIPVFAALAIMAVALLAAIPGLKELAGI